MEIRGKAFCLFEQSGAFKNAFRAFGIPAEDWDISNTYGQTDRQVDIFREIELAYAGKSSAFDEIGPEDFIFAFFPCIYFCFRSQSAFRLDAYNYRKKPVEEWIALILERNENRAHFYATLVKLLAIAYRRKFPMVIENPAHNNFLSDNFPIKPALIDRDRSARGDFFRKPTMYFFINCQPCLGESLCSRPTPLRVDDMARGHAGSCSRERSKISPEYAKRFLADYILGKEIANTQRLLFDLPMFGKSSENLPNIGKSEPGRGE